MHSISFSSLLPREFLAAHPLALENLENQPPAHPLIYPLARYLIFQQAVTKNILSIDGSFTYVGALEIPPLAQTAVMALLKEFKASGLTDLLQHMLSFAKEHLTLSLSSPFKLVGSSVFWILGIEYIEEIFKLMGLSLELSEADKELLFKKPSDIDIRVNMAGASLSEMRLMAEKTCGYLSERYGENSKAGLQLPNLKQIKPIPSECNCFFPLPILLFGRKIDIVLVSILENPVLFGENNLSIDVNKDLLEASAHFNEAPLPSIVPKALTEDVKLLPPIDITHMSTHRTIPQPAITNKGVLHAILLKVAGLKWAPLVTRINAQGAYKYILSISQQSICLSEAFERPLVQSFISMLNHVKGSEYAINLLHRSVQKHFPNEPAAYTITCFNICALFEAYDIPNKNRWSQLLFNEMRTLCKQEEMLTPKANFYALYELLKSQVIPFEVLSAYLLILGLQLEWRKRCMGQSSAISLKWIQTGGREAFFLTFHVENLSLLFSANFLQSLLLIQDFFAHHTLSEESLSHLNLLSKPFYQGGQAAWPLKNSKEFVRALNIDSDAIIQIGGEFLKHKALKTIGMTLLCLFTRSSEEFTLSLPAHLAAFQEEAACMERMPIMNTFLYAFSEHYPCDLLFAYPEKLNRYLKLINQTCTSSLDALKELCKLFSLSANKGISLAVIHIWQKASKQMPPSESFRLASEIIDSYLTLKSSGLTLALQALMTFCKNVKFSYSQLEPKLYKIYSFWQEISPRQSSQANVGTHPHMNIEGEYLFPYLFKKTALLLLAKVSPFDKHSHQGAYYLNIIQKLLHKEPIEDALTLFETVDSKNIFAKEHASWGKLRANLAEAVFKKRLYGKAYKLWRTGFPHNPKEYTALALGWREALNKISEANVEKQELQCLLIQAAEQGSTQDPSLLILALAEEYASGNLANLSLLSIGKWLLRQLHHYYQLLGSPRATRMEHYINILKLLDKEEHASYLPAWNHIGYYCFKLYHPLCQETIDPTESSLELAKQLLEESISLQAVGFVLACQNENSSAVKALIPQLIKIFPLLLVADIPQSMKPFLLASLLDLLKNTHPELENILISTHFHKEEQEELLVAALNLFSKCPFEWAEELVFDCWQLLSHSQGEQALKMISYYFQNDRHKAYSLKKKIDAFNSHFREDSFHLLCDELKREAVPHVEDLEIYLNFAILLLNSLPKQSISHKLKDDLIWLNGSLFNWLPNKGITFYRLLEGKLFSEKIAHPLALEMCRQLYSLEGPAAGYLHWSKIASNEESLNLLLEWAKSDSEGLYFNYLLMASEKSASQQTQQQLAALIGRHIINHSDRLGAFLKDIQKQSDWLVRHLKSGALRESLLEKLLEMKINLAATIDSLSLWQTLQKLFKKNAHQQAYKDLSIELLKNAKQVNEDKQAFFYLAACFYHPLDKELSYLILQNVPSLLPLPGPMADGLPTLVADLIAYLLGCFRYKETCLFLEKFGSCIPAPELAHCWEKVLIGLKGQPLQAASILWQEAPHFKDFFLEKLTPLIKQVCLQCLKLDKTEHQNLALQLISMYQLSDSKFWLACLSLMGSKGIGDRSLELVTCHASFFAGTPAEALLCWKLFLSFVAKLPSFMPALFLDQHQELLSNIQLLPRSEALVAYRNFIDCTLLLLNAPKLCESEEEKILDLLRAVSETYTVSANESDANDLHRTLAKHLINARRIACLALACDKLAALSYSSYRSTEGFFKLAKKAIMLAPSEALKDFNIHAKLKHVCYSLLQQYQKNLKLIPFQNFIEKYDRQAPIQRTCELLEAIFEEISRDPSQKLTEKHKNSIKPLIERIVATTNSNYFEKIHFYLTHPAIKEVSDDTEISHYWYQALLFQFEYYQREHNHYQQNKLLENYFNYAPCLAKISLLEKNFLYRAAAYLVDNACHNSFPEAYFQSLYSWSQQLMPKEKWPNFLEEVKKTFNSAFNEVIFQNSQAKVTTKSYFAKLIDQKGFEKVFSLNVHNVNKFFTALINYMILKSEKANEEVELQAFFLANIYFLFILLAHSSPDLEAVYEALHRLTFNNPPRDNDSASFRSHILSTIFNYLKNNRGIDKLSPQVIFEIMLVQRYGAVFPGSLKRNEIQALLTGVVETLCARNHSNQTAKAFAILRANQIEWLVDQPNKLYKCYKALFAAASKDPWLLVSRIKVKTDNFSALTLHAPILPNYYAGRIENASINRIIFSIGDSLLTMCKWLYGMNSSKCGNYLDELPKKVHPLATGVYREILPILKNLLKEYLNLTSELLSTLKSTPSSNFLQGIEEREYQSLCEEFDRLVEMMKLLPFFKMEAEEYVNKLK